MSEQAKKSPCSWKGHRNYKRFQRSEKWPLSGSVFFCIRVGVFFWHRISAGDASGSTPGSNWHIVWWGFNWSRPTPNQCLIHSSQPSCLPEVSLRFHVPPLTHFSNWVKTKLESRVFTFVREASRDLPVPGPLQIWLAILCRSLPLPCCKHLPGVSLSNKPVPWTKHYPTSTNLGYLTRYCMRTPSHHLKTCKTVSKYLSSSHTIIHLLRSPINQFCCPSNGSSTRTCGSFPVYSAHFTFYK